MLLTSLHLRFRDGAVHLAGFHKLVMRAQAHDLAILEHDNLVGMQNRRDALRDDEHRGIARLVL